MNKVVYNGCYGGFSLSDKAVERYMQLSKITYVKVNTRPLFGSTVDFFKTEPSDELKLKFLEDRYNSTTTEEERKWIDDNQIDYSRDLERHDPILVQVVEELGEEANGTYADLQIEEIIGNKYRIDEYDGNESVSTPEEKEHEWTTI